MSLMDDWKAECVRIEETRVPDGEGGLQTTWADGAAFAAAITFNSSLEARRAEKEGVTSLYSVTCDRELGLKYHDVFRRLSDGKIFRVTSDGDDVRTPARSSFSFAQVTAEEWTLPGGGGGT